MRLLVDFVRPTDNFASITQKQGSGKMTKFFTPACLFEQEKLRLNGAIRVGYSAGVISPWGQEESHFMEFTSRGTEIPENIHLRLGKMSSHHYTYVISWKKPCTQATEKGGAKAGLRGYLVRMYVG